MLTISDVPANPKIYHILHVDRLPSVIADGGLISDAEVVNVGKPGSTIGMNRIKDRRLELELDSQPGLHVGQCVPFYFCPRSIMLYVINRADHEDLSYSGGQQPIVHLEVDLFDAIEWAENQTLRWAFTLSNAGAQYFEDRADKKRLNELNWLAIGARDWRNHKHGKQAEFLIESRFSWEQVSRVGVYSKQVLNQVKSAIRSSTHKPKVEVIQNWYY